LLSVAVFGGLGSLGVYLLASGEVSLDHWKGWLILAEAVFFPIAGVFFIVSILRDWSVAEEEYATRKFVWAITAKSIRLIHQKKSPALVSQSEAGYAAMSLTVSRRE